jgi:uncharacterized protein (TIGR03083 family)
MDDPVLAAFTAECRAAEETLAGIGPSSWSRPALGEWDLHELAAHLVGGAARLAEYAVDPVGGDAPACDRVTYFQMDLAAAAPAVAQRARDRAAGLPPTDVAEEFGRAWRATADVVAMRGADALTATLRGPMRMDEYLATRVLEVCVHHLDVRTALDLPPASAPEASRVTMEILEGLLGGPRPRNLGRHRFILAATGRVGSDDPRLPVLR